MTILYFPEHKLRFIRIPKNACSTVMNSLGHSVINGAHPHQFGARFEAAQEGAKDWPCIAVLRDPFERAVSAYLNKLTDILAEELFVHELLDYVWRAQRMRQRPDWRTSITFREFVVHLASFPDEQLDMHWRSQSSFLGGEQPSVVLEMRRLEDQWKMHPLLRSIELRNFAPHATHSQLNIGEDVFDVPGEAFVGFKMVCGQYPSPESFRDPYLVDLIQKRFADDYRLLAAANFYETTGETSVSRDDAAGLHDVVADTRAKVEENRQADPVNQTA
ncbi:sulfotransferase family 2 domain-containing protein [Caballeronia sp. LZ025]|uniref:sulfotransferase family 2 domain-containing protein n=1 Tax=Caballeronia TaxID=1827195 RepID=UPI001FD58007|nr:MULTISPECIES: sulfotransferase family 2 domain-containing protein [Caballeronia]MDR5732656.1 sulfotransferase family 2 domain-containing protein [Caballeronia sp. LZ025]